MNKIITLSALIAATAITACSESAGSIPATHVPTTQWENMSCSQLQGSLTAAETDVQTLTRQQNNAATADVVGVFLVLIPISKIAGLGVEEQLAYAKGERNAIRQQIAITCN